MTWLGWIVIGGIAGYLASVFMKDESGGIVKNVIVGILGALLGGWLFNQFGADGFGDASWVWSLVVATVGSVILIWLIGLFTGRTKVS